METQRAHAVKAYLNLFNTKICYAYMRDIHIVGKNGKSIPVTGRGGM
jgi:hypothetical protein